VDCSLREPPYQDPSGRFERGAPSARCRYVLRGVPDIKAAGRYRGGAGSMAAAIGYPLRVELDAGQHGCRLRKRLRIFRTQTVFRGGLFRQGSCRGYPQTLADLPLVPDVDEASTQHSRDAGTARQPKAPLRQCQCLLILNTYHELENRPPILNQIFQSLVSGGRLVIVDPIKTDHGDLLPAVVEEELRSLGFEIVRRDDRFIDQPAGRPWWLIVVRKP
jgi:hypothetical protein